MLIDDNPHDNFFHSRVIEACHAAKHILVMEMAEEALQYLKALEHSPGLKPNIIFLDINMPGMNGWEFLDEYKLLDKSLQSEMLVMMLTTSNNPKDDELAQKHGVPVGFRTKPLTEEMLQEVLSKCVDVHQNK
jgi:CheY-like chemotaxis protein